MNTRLEKIFFRTGREFGELTIIVPSKDPASNIAKAIYRFNISCAKWEAGYQQRAMSNDDAIFVSWLQSLKENEYPELRAFKEHLTRIGNPSFNRYLEEPASAVAAAASVPPARMNPYVRTARIAAVDQKEPGATMPAAIINDRFLRADSAFYNVSQSQSSDETKSNSSHSHTQPILTPPTQPLSQSQVADDEFVAVSASRVTRALSRKLSAAATSAAALSPASSHSHVQSLLVPPAQFLSQAPLAEEDSAVASVGRVTRANSRRLSAAASAMPVRAASVFFAAASPSAVHALAQATKAAVASKRKIPTANADVQAQSDERAKKKSKKHHASASAAAAEANKVQTSPFLRK